MKKNLAFFLTLLLTLALAGCSGREDAPDGGSAPRPNPAGESRRESGPAEPLPEDAVALDGSILQLEPGLSAVRFDGDYGFGGFLEQGGASSDGEVAQYLAENLLGGVGLEFPGGLFGCSTIAADSPDGDALFGRNFDCDRCDAMVVEAHPGDGYASLATVNLDFITRGRRVSWTRR